MYDVIVTQIYVIRVVRVSKHASLFWDRLFRTPSAFNNRRKAKQPRKLKQVKIRYIFCVLLSLLLGFLFWFASLHLYWLVLDKIAELSKKMASGPKHTKGERAPFEKEAQPNLDEAKVREAMAKLQSQHENKDDDGFAVGKKRYNSSSATHEVIHNRCRC